MLKSVMSRAATSFPCHFKHGTKDVHQIRNTCIFSRMHPPALPKRDMEKLPFRLRLKKREHVYILEDNYNCKPQGNMEVILTEDVEGVGLSGDLVEVKKSSARNNLLPNKAAVYASPENMEKYNEIRSRLADVPRQTLTGRKTARELGGLQLPVPMSSANPWILNRTHIKIALRLAGVVVPEQCISLPDESVTEPGEVPVKIMINKLDKVTVTAMVYHFRKGGGEETKLLPEWTAEEVPHGTILRN